MKKLPPMRFELTTPGLRDQCSTTELKRPSYVMVNGEKSHTEKERERDLLQASMKLHTNDPDGKGGGAES